MTEAVASDFRTLVAHRIEASCEILAGRWIDQLTTLVPARDDIFPGEQPLQHAQAIIRELATYVQLPMHESIAANAVVTARATELGHLCHAQRASLHQVPREYRVLRNVIAQFIEEQIGHLELAPKPAELIELMNRLDSVIDVLQQTTADTFVTEYTQTITKHTTRLESFNRMVTHELRQPLGTFQFAVKLLQATETWTDPVKRGRILESAERNVARMTETLSKLVALSRSAHGAESAFVQQVEMSTVTTDVIGQLREMADARAVEMRITTPLPTVTIDVARLDERDRRTSGLGLGLSIVADCVDALKGDIHVEATLGEGTTFFIELPVAPDT